MKSLDPVPPIPTLAEQLPDALPTPPGTRFVFQGQTVCRACAKETDLVIVSLPHVPGASQGEPPARHRGRTVKVQPPEPVAARHFPLARRAGAPILDGFCVASLRPVPEVDRTDRPDGSLRGTTRARRRRV